MSEDSQIKTQALVLLPAMLADIQKRVKEVEVDSTSTKVAIGEINVHLQNQTKILEKIDKRMDDGEDKFSDHERRLGGLETTGKTTWKIITFFVSLSGALGALFGWLFNHQEKLQK